jgi:flagellar hook-length control protein FliK
LDTSGAAAQLDTTAPRWNEALAGRIQWMVDNDVGEARIRLNPPDLGALDVKISLVDDKTYVQLAASNPTARDELTQHLPRLRELLSSGGLDLAGATVSDGRAQHSGRSPAAAVSEWVGRLESPVADAEPSSSRAARRSSTRIDLYA